jgi:hypothetical protein
MLPKVSVFLSDIIEPLLYETGISAQDIRALLPSEEWSACASRNQQVVFCHDFAQIRCDVRLSAAQMGKGFRIRAARVHNVRCTADSEGTSPGPPLALGANQEMAVVDFIRAGYASGSHVTCRAILYLVKREFQNFLRYSWIQSALARNGNIIHATTVSPQEKVRLEVACQILDGR